MKTKLRRGDEVVVVTGREKGKRGKILRIDREAGRILIEGVNMTKKTLRKSQQNPNGGIAEVEAALHISNVMAVEKGGQRTRLAYKTDGKEKTRVGRRTGDEI
jgi:large subunit ribosomal protein L24